MNKLSNSIKLVVFLITLTFSGQSFSQGLMMARIKQSFPETMVSLQSAIKKAGYTISRVQRIDIGLTKSGFKTDKYRVVFFGKAEEVEKLTSKHPEITPLLPLKISIFAENNDTIIVSNNPMTMKGYFKKIPSHYFTNWEKDVKRIFMLTGVVE